MVPLNYSQAGWGSRSTCRLYTYFIFPETGRCIICLSCPQSLYRRTVSRTVGNIFYSTNVCFGLVSWRIQIKWAFFFFQRLKMGHCHPHLPAMEGNNWWSRRSRDCVFAHHKTAWFSSNLEFVIESAMLGARSSLWTVKVVEKRKTKFPITAVLRATIRQL